MPNDYLLAVKGNQPSLQAAIEGAFIDAGERTDVDRLGRVDNTHGRTVGQIASVLPAQGVVDVAEWPKCATIGRIDSLRVVGGSESPLEQRYYISSRALTAADLATAVRAHWGIENRLHWVLDVSMGEDGSTLRKDNRRTAESLAAQEDRTQHHPRGSAATPQDESAPAA